ncbi:MAG TPA: DUF4352 domain-containing protein [Ktedonobacterales bacterium]|jgi:hypothetical protein
MMIRWSAAFQTALQRIIISGAPESVYPAFTSFPSPFTFSLYTGAIAIHCIVFYGYHKTCGENCSMRRWRLFTPWFIRRKRARHHRWRRAPGLAALGIVLGGLLIGCTVDQSTLQRDPFMRDMMSLQQQVDQPHKIGQTFDVGNTRWNIRAAHAALTLRLGSNMVKARGKFVVIDFTFTNTTDQPQHPTADMLQIEDAQLNTHKSDATTTAMLASWQKTPNFLKATFQPNKRYPCSLVFDLPVQTSGLTLEFQSFPTEDDPPPDM